MKFLSLDHLVTQASETFRRFYLPLLFAIAGTCAGIALIAEQPAENSILIRLLYTCIIGGPFSIGTTLYTERYLSAKQYMPIVVLVLMALYGIFLAPKGFWENNTKVVIFTVLCIVMHLWVAIAPFVKTDERYGFWRYNEQLYVRIVLSAIFSGVLFAGLAVALLALDNLLKVPVNDRLYAQLWVTIVGVFNTWFFLSGIPRDFAELNNEKPFPKGLRVFTQYILIPLATIYMIILYIYGGKILITWNLPKGWVSMLIMCYSVIGILAVLLVYPLRNDEENTWVKLFSRFFFIAMLPVVVLLYVAIGVRVHEYGLTESRYYIILLGSWLAFIALYFVFSKSKNIKTIPASLLLVGLLSVFGPWSSFSLSVNSQVRRLKEVLVENKIWSNGALHPRENLNKTTVREVQSIIRYLLERDEEKKLNAIFNQDIVQLRKAMNLHLKSQKDVDGYVSVWGEREVMTDTLMSLLHLPKNTNEMYYPGGGIIKYTSISEDGFMDVHGYSKIYHYYYGGIDAKPLWHNKDSINVVYNKKAPSIVLKDKSGELVSFDLQQLLNNLEKDKLEDNIPQDKMTIQGTGRMEAVLNLESITVDEHDADKEVSNLEGYIMLR